MAAIRLTAEACEKPWGRRDLRPWSDAPGAAPVGEMIYTPPGGDTAELLVKLLFTGERLSVQVHPGDDAARAAGHARGKDEAWLILAAAPGAVIGLGLRETVSADRLAAAARDGSIEALLDWRPVAAGDMLLVPAGTIHAIGAGITLVEVQQNLDVTYRLFDYGRPRALHVEAAVAVAAAGPWTNGAAPVPLGDGRTALVEGPSFVIERLRSPGAGRLQPPADRPATIVVLAGCGRIDGQPCRDCEVWLVDTDCSIDLEPGSDVLVTYPGAAVAADLWSAFRQAA